MKGDEKGKNRSTRNHTPPSSKEPTKSTLANGVRSTPKKQKPIQQEPKDAQNEKQAPEKTPPKTNTSSSTPPGTKGENAKKAGANTTGVEDNGKSKKDKLEHQVADKAMDATPGLSQFNNARKALKKYNQGKKKMGAEEGLTDKVEKVADDAVDKGIKGVKLAAGAKIGVDMGMAAMAMAMAMKMLMMLKGMAFAILGKIAGFFAGIFSAVSGFISSVLGVAAGVGQAIASILMVVAVASTGMLGYGLVESVTRKDDSGGMCVPTTTRVPKGLDYEFGEGGIAMTNEESAKKLWSVYSEIGGSKAQTAAVLGNLHVESGGLDPTAVETIYNEYGRMGPSKQDAMAKDFLIKLVNPGYSAKYPNIKYMGIGLAQWTNGRNRLLLDYAKGIGENWYEFDTQMKFMLVADDKLRQKQLRTFLKANPSNVSKETERFMNTWIGLSSPNKSLSSRQQNAKDYMFALERIEADTEYAESILSGLNVTRSAANTKAGSYHQDDGCGKPIKSHYANVAVDGTGEVPSDLVLTAWTRESFPESLKEYWKNPEDAGLMWGNATGWATGIYPDQCAAFAHSYFMRLYPGWNQEGRPTKRPFGDGGVAATKWASHYREKVSSVPKAGAIFSDKTASSAGHTGIVQHVFKNGDILIIEQNVPGASGQANNMSYSWSWRVIKKDRYLQAKWTFFKPSTAEPQWTSG